MMLILLVQRENSQTGRRPKDEVLLLAEHHAFGVLGRPDGYEDHQDDRQVEDIAVGEAE